LVKAVEALAASKLAVVEHGSPPAAVPAGGAGFVVLTPGAADSPPYGSNLRYNFLGVTISTPKGSISNILRRAPVKCGRSFLYTETDDDDLTHFIISQTQVIRRAIRELHAYIERTTAEVREVESRMRALDLFNHRQVEIVRHALKHPWHRYTFASQQKSHNVVYQTTRTDLLDLAERGVLERREKGKQMVFVAPADLSTRLMKLEKEAGS
jgi:hypothetical protein